MGAKHDDPITQEEVFGPVLSVYRFKDTDEALTAANGTSCGLAATIWSQDIRRVLQVASKLECGKVVVNGAFRRADSQSAASSAMRRISHERRMIRRWAWERFLAG